MYDNKYISKALNPSMSDHMRPKVQYMFRLNQADKETSDIEKKPGIGE